MCLQCQGSEAMAGDTRARDRIPEEQEQARLILVACLQSPKLREAKQGGPGAGANGPQGRQAGSGSSQNSYMGSHTNRGRSDSSQVIHHRSQLAALPSAEEASARGKRVSAMLGSLWRQSKIELDEAFDKYELALKEAQKIANRVKARNFPRQLATCKALKQEADTAKYALKEFAVDLKKSIPFW